MDRDTEWVELKISGDRTKRGYLVRTSTREEKEALTNDMQRAKDEIDRAYRIIAGMMYAGSNDLTKIPGNEGSDEEWQQTQIDRLDEWAKSIVKINDGRGVYNICLDICAFGMSYRECAASRGMAASTVMRKLRVGLNDYCILRGWGDQIKGLQG